MLDDIDLRLTDGRAARRGWGILPHLHLGWVHHHRRPSRTRQRPAARHACRRPVPVNREAPVRPGWDDRHGDDGQLRRRTVHAPHHQGLVGRVVPPGVLWARFDFLGAGILLCGRREDAAGEEGSG